MTAAQKAFIAQIELALRELGAEIVSFDQKLQVPAWDLILDRDGHIWPLRLVTVGWSIDELPVIYWRRPAPIWGWPHVSCTGDVCVSDREGLEYDPEDVHGVIEWLLQEAARLLAHSSAMEEQERQLAFADELEGYLRNDGSSSVILDDKLDITESLYAEVAFMRRGRSGPITPKVCRVNQGTTKLPACHQERLGLFDVTIHQIYGLLSEWGNDWWDIFLSRLSPSQRAVAVSPKNRGVVLRVPSNFGHSLLLLYWGLRPAKMRSTYLLQRQDHEYLVQRTGGEPDMRHVIVAGCGSIGSRVAEHLALAGVSKITLVDNDKFSPDNLGRHVLGKQSISKSKVDELATLLKERMPGIQIEARTTSVQKALAKGDLAGADAIVLATGNSTLERSIARRAFRERWPSLIVSTSVEAAGLGGHAIAMRPGTPGCLDCLYIDPDTQAPLPNMRTALMAPGQKVTRQLTGCGAFTPYSALDATRTALLAAERVLTNVPLYSRWAGEAVLAKAEGIQHSATYEALRTRRIASDITPSEFAQPRCPCCSV
ncbi:ThiF family adenylyltransferase [Aeromonas hydrophila]|uniref:ThiF family adenylyltransferase n=1 Tax=Aeromonas hydrophila TaxID=644 RepID=UPI0038CF8161